MKKITVFLCAMLLVFGSIGIANAVTYDFNSIATGTYSETDFSNLFSGV